MAGGLGVERIRGGTAVSRTPAVRHEHGFANGDLFTKASLHLVAFERCWQPVGGTQDTSGWYVKVSAMLKHFFVQVGTCFVFISPAIHMSSPPLHHTSPSLYTFSILFEPVP